VSQPHFFVEDLRADRIALSAADTRHALRSLRLRPGDPVTLSDGQGVVADGRIGRETDGLAAVEIVDRRRVARPHPLVSVALAPPKGERLAWAIQKLGELGVDRTLLVRAERSVRDWDDQERAERAVARLEGVAREAAMQSRRPFVMQVEPPAAFDRVLEAAGAVVVVLWEGSDVSMDRSLPEEPEEIRLVVGPEGGLSDQEVERARGGGAALASLGPGVLRTETAAIAASALVLARYGRLG
jgi:16S rRNA (uracil1498-N3)-methyltransferase